MKNIVKLEIFFKLALTFHKICFQATITQVMGTSSQIKQNLLGTFEPWKPVDNLLLIMNMLHTENVRQTFMGSKFSKHYTLKQVKNQWYRLLNSEMVANSALRSIKELSKHTRHNIYKKLLLNSEEQAIICQIKTFEEPTLQTFENLLKTHADKFHWTRTAKCLLKNWQTSIQRQCPNQQVLEVRFRDFLPEREHELKIERRIRLHDIRKIETKIESWNSLIKTLSQQKMHDFSYGAICSLTGKRVVFNVKCQKSTIGRNSQVMRNDMDLSLEGSCSKISHRQAILVFTQQFEFFLINLGRFPILLNGCPLLTNFKTRLCHQTIIAFDSLEFVFKINKDLIYTMKNQASCE